MTSDRTRTRARLASALDEAADIETRAIDEVRAALAEQGIDPTASIRLAQKLTQGRATGDPSARLMQHIERSEALNAEIAALEEADIDDIKAALPRQHAGRSSEAEMAPIEAGGRRPEAQRQRSEPSRRRLPMLGWGGSLIGIAASVLLFVMVRPDRLDQVEMPLPAIEAEAPLATDAERADAVSEDVLQRSDEPAQALSSDFLELRESRSDDRGQFAASEAGPTDAAQEALVEETDERPDPRSPENAPRPLAQRRAHAPVEKAEADLSTEASAPKLRPLPSPSRLAVTDGESGGTAASSPETLPAPAMAEPPRNPPRPVPRPNVEKRGAAEMAVLRPGTPSASADRVETPFFPGRGSEFDVLSPIIGDLKAVLLVDKTLAPDALRTLAKRLPQGRLAARVGEAERRASGGQVVALVAFTRDGELVEAALVEAWIAPLPDPPAQAFDGVTAFIDGYAPAFTGSEASFELIELSAGD